MTVKKSAINIFQGWERVKKWNQKQDINIVENTS